MKRPRVRPLLVLLLVVIAAIGGLYLRNRSRESGMAFAPPSATAAMTRAMPKSPDARESAAEPETASDALDAMDAARRLVRTASVTLEVTRYGDAAARAEAIASAHGGFLADARVSRDS